MSAISRSVRPAASFSRISASRLGQVHPLVAGRRQTADNGIDEMSQGRRRHATGHRQVPGPASADDADERGLGDVLGQIPACPRAQGPYGFDVVRCVREQHDRDTREPNGQVPDQVLAGHVDDMRVEENDVRTEQDRGLQCRGRCRGLTDDLDARDGQGLAEKRRRGRPIDDEDADGRGWPHPRTMSPRMRRRRRPIRSSISVLRARRSVSAGPLDQPARPSDAVQLLAAGIDQRSTSSAAAYMELSCRVVRSRTTSSALSPEETHRSRSRPSPDPSGSVRSVDRLHRRRRRTARSPVRWRAEGTSPVPRCKRQFSIGACAPKEPTAPTRTIGHMANYRAELAVAIFAIVVLVG